MSTSQVDIRAVAFDYGGVLAYFISKETISKMAKLAQVDYHPFNSSMWKFRHELDSGEYDNNRYWGAVLDDCNSPISREAHVTTLVEMDLRGFSKMNQGMLCWANELKKCGIATIIISNMSQSTYQSLMVEQEWMRQFDTIVISGIIGINKPDKRIFNHAIEQTQLQAHEILFLDDLPYNVEGAKKAGLHSLLFSNTDTLAQDLQKGFPNLPVEGLACSTS